jgi:hypothetical protein
MEKQLTIKRTTSDDIDFQQLVTMLDNELWNELNEDQSTYDQYNKVPGLDTVIVIYENIIPVAIGCFKKYDEETVEIKRMFVKKDYRGRGISRLVLEELEGWAIESGFNKSILETSVKFKPARGLYTAAGYAVIDNYDQYKGLAESVCMKKELSKTPSPSPFRAAAGIEYFDFEEDFIEKDIRCIPMTVRFKLDKAGIKLKLAEWNRFNVNERLDLATRACSTELETRLYNEYLAALIKEYTGKEATALTIDRTPEWADTTTIPGRLKEKLHNYNWNMSIEQWQRLTELQRFALLKLCRPGHESKNFPKAIKEFGLT